MHQNPNVGPVPAAHQIGASARRGIVDDQYLKGIGRAVDRLAQGFFGLVAWYYDRDLHVARGIKWFGKNW